MNFTESPGSHVSLHQAIAPQVDYRERPNAGQAALEQHDPDSREAPNHAGHPVAPQPDIGAHGYSLNALDAPPNRMVPQASALAAGQTPENAGADTLGAWDLWTYGGAPAEEGNR